MNKLNEVLDNLAIYIKNEDVAKEILSAIIKDLKEWRWSEVTNVFINDERQHGEYPEEFLTDRIKELEEARKKLK